MSDGTRVYTTEEMLRVVEAREAADRGVVDKPAESILRTRREGYIDAGDEGKVFSNFDGSVTKVYQEGNTWDLPT